MNLQARRTDTIKCLNSAYVLTLGMFYLSTDPISVQWPAMDTAKLQILEVSRIEVPLFAQKPLSTPD